MVDIMPMYLLLFTIRQEKTFFNHKKMVSYKFLTPWQSKRLLKVTFWKGVEK